MRILVLIVCLLFGACVEEEKKEVVATDFRSSISLLSKKILENPNDVSLLKERSDLFLSQGKLEGALIDSEFIYELDSNNYQSLSNLSNIYFQLGENGKPDYYKKAFFLLQKDIVTLKNNSTDLSLRYKLYFMLGKFKESLADINRVLKIDKYIAEAYFYKGLNYCMIGDTVKAISQFQTAVEQDPNYIDAYHNLAVIYDLLGDSIAELYFNNALDVDSTSTIVLYSQGKYYQDRLKFEKAKKCYLSVLRFDPKYTPAYYNLGFIALSQKEFLLGANYFSEVIYFNPDFATAYFSRALCFVELGQADKAELDFNKTLEINPNFREAKLELAKIK
jgi:tetratricopeptide (TPR) repeat protein